MPDATSRHQPAIRSTSSEEKDNVSAHIPPTPSTPNAGVSPTSSSGRVAPFDAFQRTRRAPDAVTKPDEDALAVRTMRTLAMDGVQQANSGHPGAAMALSPLAWTIFAKRRVHDPKDPQWIGRDRFVLSAGHASMLQYAALHLSGYDLSLDDIRNFRQWESKTPGHPEYGMTPGVETTTGPLGQGFANAVGMAMAARLHAIRYNRPGFALFNNLVFVVASDGDLMEGISYEAASLAGHLQLGRLVVFWDDNEITIDGSTGQTFTEDVLGRFAALGWHTQTVADGNDLQALERASQEAERDPRPSLVRVRTVIAYPSPGKQGTSASHGAPLGQEEVAKTKAVLGADPKASFDVPQRLNEVRERIIQRGAEARAQWTSNFEAYAQKHPELATQMTREFAGELNEGWSTAVPAFPPGSTMATRKASGTVLQALAKAVPNLVGGSADLAASNNSMLEGFPAMSPADARLEASGANLTSEIPRNVHWGIREHAMGAALNGMALFGGLIPYGATFLIFSEYMRAPIRLASLMELPVRYVFTHDSIGLGEDGPTHQPVEQLACLRAIPGLAVLRPADAEETRVCWQEALRWKGPAAMVLSRQNLKHLDRDPPRPDVQAAERSASGEAGDLAMQAARGAYVLREMTGASADAAVKVLLIASGSEVELAVKAQEALHGEGIGSRVISMPCWALFEAQSQAYRDAVIDPRVQARVVIEAGVRMGWERYAGAHAGFVTLEHFGASAPAETLFEAFGFTVENVVRVAKRALASS